jgi:DNA gyrase/topoisomerase IV subunit B
MSMPLMAGPEAVRKRPGMYMGSTGPGVDYLSFKTRPVL